MGPAAGEKSNVYLRDIVEVTVSQTAVAPTSKCHDNAPVCKLKIKRGGIRDSVRRMSVGVLSQGHISNPRKLIGVAAIKSDERQAK